MFNKILISFILIITLFQFSSAAVVMVSPLNGTNHSSANSLIFNVTFVNSTDILARGLTQTTFITNSSACALSTGSTIACWTIFTPTSSNDGFFNITSQIFNGTATVNSSVNTTSVYFDSSVPLISADNFTSPVIGSNFSGSLRLNVSIIDLTIGVQYVFFNITNSSGQQNATVVASNSAGNYWNATINTLAFPDGVYNITAYVNDSLNNQNNSAVIYSVRFDNTAPTVSVSCVPNSVQQGETVSCSCSGSDVTTNINETIIDANPDTSQTGTFSNSCTVRDTAGNSGLGSTSYSVTSSSTGGGSGGGSGSGGSSNTDDTEEETEEELEEQEWTETFVVEKEDLAQGETRNLAVNNRIEITINDAKHHVGLLAIGEQSAKIIISSTPIEITMSVGQSEKFELTNDEYYDLQVTLNSIEDNTATIELKSIQEQITYNDLDSENKSSYLIWIIIIVIIIAIGFFYWKKNYSV